MPVIEPLSKDLYDELRATCRGPIHVRGDPEFGENAMVFNGNVVTRSKAMVCPLDAEDVSNVVLYCVKHSLSPSVKAGGYGTGGWAIGGDIIVDVSKLVEIDMEIPTPEGSFTSLRDVAPANSKGKRALEPSAVPPRRKRREDLSLRDYDAASEAVASFLWGPPLPEFPDFIPSNSGTLPTSIDTSQMFTPPFAPDSSTMPSAFAYLEAPTSHLSTGSSTTGLSSSYLENNSPLSPSVATRWTTPALPPVLETSASHGVGVLELNPDSGLNYPSNTSPFSYLDTQSNFPPAPEPRTLVSQYTQSFTSSGPWFSSSSALGQTLPVIPAQAGPIHPHVYVTFGAGMHQKDVDTFTAQHKIEARYLSGSGDGIAYHVPFSAHPVGSSVMLLGGFGFLSRLHGLSIDNLVEVEMVLADGRIVIVSENEYPDLWWALRGAGTCMGIATRYKAKAYPVPVVFAGNLIYRFNKATAPSLIQHFRDCVKGAPRELYANVLLTAGPADKESLVVLQMCYIGPREKGQEYLQALSSWDGGRCLLNEVDEKSFLHQQDSVAQVLRGKAGRQWYIRSALVSSLPDDIITKTVIQFANTPLGCTWLFELAGGAIMDFEDNCVPKSQREASFTIAALHQWEIDVHDDRCVDSAEEWISGTMQSVQMGGPFPSFLGRHEPVERTKGSFGANWKRLCEIKEFYDPHNLFRNNFWPLNERREEVGARLREPPTPPFIPVRGQNKKIFIQD